MTYDKVPPKFGKAPLLGLNDLIAWAFLALSIVVALFRPLIPYDSWGYHLPFSSYLFAIGGGNITFHMNTLLDDRWLGFPKAWEWIEGLVWASTGSLRLTIVPQIVLCLAYFFYLGRVYTVPVSWLICGFFASPLLLIHFQSIYLDLPAGLCVALGFFLLLDLLVTTRTRDAIFSWRTAASAVATLGLAGNIKYQGFFMAACVLAVTTILILTARDMTGRFRLIILATIAAASLLASATLVTNLVRTHNPFYPLAITVLGTNIFIGPESQDTDVSYPTYLLSESRPIALPEPVNFILSITELDWTMRGVAPWYNIDSVSGRTPRRGEPSRTGGLGALFVLLNGFLLVFQAANIRRELDLRQRLLVFGAVLLTFFTVFMPRAHELRYWLYLPLVLLPINMRYLFRMNYHPAVPVALVAMMLYGVSLAVLSPKSELLTRRALSMAELRAEIPPAIAKSLSDTGRYCDAEHDNLFRYSQAVTGLPGLVSSNVADCR
jgi:hypothetical protein